MAVMALTREESFWAVRTKKGLCDGDIERLVAENEMMGTRAFSPSFIINVASPELSGPIIACTFSFFTKSTTANIWYIINITNLLKKKKKKL